jgi:hypothetical protein
MAKRIVLAQLCLGLVVLATGCLEIKETITLNPDGKGKAVLDLVIPSKVGGLAAGPAPKERSIDDMKNDTVGQFLTGNKGVTGWNDVSAEWMPDGRLHFVGTAYFDDLAAYSSSDGNQMATMPQYKLKNDKEGEWKLTQGLTKKDSKKPDKDLPDPKKLSDKELDEYVLKQRIEYQSGKAIFIAMLTDYKAKTTIKLPGTVGDVKGFKKEGDHAVSRDFNGAAILKEVEQFMAKDNAFFRNTMRDAGTIKILEGDASLIKNLPAVADATLTLKEVGKDQFDYAKELKEAHNGIPKLRERFNIDKNKLLPGEKTTAPKSER